MRYDLSGHPHFQAWTDPESGITSYILSERVAPVQENFYFVNSGISADERWLWFYAAFPPGPTRTLGVVSLDPQQPLIRHFPAAQLTSGAPMVAPEGDAAFFAQAPSVWRQPLEGAPSIVCTVDPDWINHRQIRRLASHLTLSADGRYFLLDGDIGRHWWVGVGDRQTGEVKVLYEFARHQNHAQFSTTAPKMFLIAQDWWHDRDTGQYFPYDHRIWLMDIDQTIFEPLQPRDWYRHGTAASHEWWSKDGLICWVDYEEGAFECELNDRVACKVWQGPLCHAHCDATRRYWVADESPYKWGTKPCQLLFYDREADRRATIVSSMPLHPLRRRYGVDTDPHPSFSPQGTYIAYTTPVRGTVDVAVVPVDEVLARL